MYTYTYIYIYIYIYISFVLYLHASIDRRATGVPGVMIHNSDH